MPKHYAIVVCKVLGHKQSNREVECDGEFKEVTYYCARCQSAIATVPWEQAPLEVRHNLVNIAAQFKKNGIIKQ